MDMKLLDQALTYGSISNIKEWKNGTALQRLVTLAEEGTLKGGQRLINNYFQCLRGIKSPLDLHYADNGILKDSGRSNRHILLRLKDVFRDTPDMFERLAAIYIAHFDEVEVGLLCDDVHPSGGRALTKALFEIYGKMMSTPQLRRWYNAIRHPHKERDTIALLTLGMEPAMRLEQGQIETAMIVDNVKVLTSSKVRSSKGALLARVKELVEKAPQYWEYVKLAYIPHCHRLDLEFDEIKSLLKLAPEVIKLSNSLKPEELSNFDALTWKLWKMPSTKCAYLLGFPIQYGTPGVKAIKEALFKLSRDGPKEYAAYMCRMGSNLVRFMYPGLTCPGTEDVDESDDEEQEKDGSEEQAKEGSEKKQTQEKAEHEEETQKGSEQEEGSEGEETRPEQEEEVETGKDQEEEKTREEVCQAETKQDETQQTTPTATVEKLVKKIKRQIQPDECRDMLSHRFNSYGPFDRICYMEEDNLFEFTRPGWEDMIKKGKNPHTRQTLARTIVLELITRESLAKSYDLPAPAPLQILLEKLLVRETLPLPEESKCEEKKFCIHCQEFHSHTPSFNPFLVGMQASRLSSSRLGNNVQTPPLPTLTGSLPSLSNAVAEAKTLLRMNDANSIPNEDLQTDLPEEEDDPDLPELDDLSDIPHDEEFT